MNNTEKILYYRNLDAREFKFIMQKKDELLMMSNYDFNLFFLNINDSFKKDVIDDIDLFDKVLSIPPNRLKKYVFDFVSNEIFEYIFNHSNILKSKISYDVLENYISSLSCDEVQRLLYYNILVELFSRDRDVLGEVKDYVLSSYQYQNLKRDISKKIFSPVALFSINNAYELFIYQKFHILIDVCKVVDDELCIGDKVVSFSFLESVSKKHIVSLIDIAKRHQDMVKNCMLFVTVIKLYMIFGYDGSKKILEQFFTYATDASISRASIELFHDQRRAYRLQNNHQFYFYGIEDYFDEALMNDDYEYFRLFCGRDDEYVYNFILSVKERLFDKKGDGRREEIKNIILEEIQKREAYFLNLEVLKNKQYYESISRDNDVTLDELYYYFSNVIISPNISSDGKVIPDQELIKVFLGNCKKDNDCLLRMIFNRHALGLNEEIYHIINHFEELKDIVSRSKSLSLYSILDIIDISKVFLYHLKPDELDISLETFLKVLHSRKFCSEDVDDILKRVLRLHKLRKFKISCAVPFIKGEYNDVLYEIVLPYDEKLLASGIETDSCFKVGGPGEGLFEYCLTNPLGCVLYLNYKNCSYVLPCTINGNMFNINGIEPRIKDYSVFEVIKVALENISNNIIFSTSNIDIVTITNFHHEEFMKNSGLKSISIDEFIPLGTDIYSDYNKHNIIHYILGKRDSFSSIKYFNNMERFFIKRFQPYVFSSSQESDYERIELLLNQIAYASIEFMDISEEEKTIMRDNYELIGVNDFSYIVGNMDWFIGINYNGNVVECVLPYDDRGVVEYEMYRQSVINDRYDVNCKVKKRD